MNCTRRVFLTTASGLALSAPMAAASVQGANTRVRVAIIGTGSRARGLMSQLNSIAGVEIVAIRDSSKPRRLPARPRSRPPSTAASSTIARSTPSSSARRITGTKS